MNGLDKLATSNQGLGWGGNHPGLAFDEDVTSSVYDSRERDLDWIARELGDVPVRERGPLCATECSEGDPPSWMGVRCIPVESLGRDKVEVHVSPYDIHATWTCEGAGARDA
jgi:hypothetical protein